MDSNHINVIHTTIFIILIYFVSYAFYESEKILDYANCGQFFASSDTIILWWFFFSLFGLENDEEKISFCWDWTLSFNNKDFLWKFNDHLRMNGFLSDRCSCRFGVSCKGRNLEFFMQDSVFVRFHSLFDSVSFLSFVWTITNLTISL